MEEKLANLFNDCRNVVEVVNTTLDLINKVDTNLPENLRSHERDYKIEFDFNVPKGCDSDIKKAFTDKNIEIKDCSSLKSDTQLKYNLNYKDNKRKYVVF